MTSTLTAPATRPLPSRAGEIALGVDTHRDLHVAAVLSSLGAVLGTAAFPTTAAGYRQLLEWACQFGKVSRAGVEGAGSYGAGLCRYLLAQRIEVIDVNRPDRAARRRNGKTDPLDAQEAARAVLNGRARVQAKTGDGPVQSARMFKLAKDSAVKARTQAINQLKAIVVTADPVLRDELAGLSNSALFRTCARFGGIEEDGGPGQDVLQATRITLCLLAQRIEQLTEQIRALDTGGHWAGQRCDFDDCDGRQSGTPPQRGVVRCAVRGQPHRVLLGARAVLAAQPWGRPAGQFSAPPHCARPPPVRPPYPGLLRTAHRGRQDPT